MFEDDMTPLGHRYYPTLRPSSIGTQQDGVMQVADSDPRYAVVKWQRMSGGLPRKFWTLPDGWKLDCFGWVEYEQPLAFERIWKFDLAPADTIEWAHYQIWEGQV